MSRGRHARDGQRQDALRAWLHSLPARAELTWRWCHWKLIAHPRYARALRGALSAPTTPAPAEAPGQAPRPADPSRSGGAARCGPGQLMTPGAVADGTGPDAGDAPSPAADATTTPDGGVAQLPRPELVPPWAGPGQPQRPAWVIFPDDRAALREAGRTSIRGLAWEGHARETGGMPALVRPAYARHEAFRDAAAVTL